MELLAILGTVAVITLGAVVILARYATLAERLYKSVKESSGLQRELDGEKHAREDRDQTLGQLQEELKREREARHLVETTLDEALKMAHPADVVSAINRELQRLRELSKVPTRTSTKTG